MYWVLENPDCYYNENLAKQGDGMQLDNFIR